MPKVFRGRKARPEAKVRLVVKVPKELKGFRDHRASKARRVRKVFKGLKARKVFKDSKAPHLVQFLGRR